LSGYKLTDRGKIFVTVVIVLIVLFLPAAILLLTGIAAQPSPPPTDNDSQAVVTPPPSVTESPPPNGGGFTPPDISSPNGGNGPENPEVPEDPEDPSAANGQEPPQAPEVGQGSVDPVEGTLSFFFSPGLHEELDDETQSMLDVFLGSPRNTPDSTIIVETPQIPLADSDALFATIGSAFNSRGIHHNRVAYAMRPETAADDAFEVNLFYIVRTIK